MSDITESGTHRRDLFKGAAGIAVGAAAASMLPGGVAAAAGKTQATMTIDDIGTFELLAFSWGASQSASTHVGGGGGAGRASFQDVSFTKSIDELSPLLLQMVATGTHAPRARLTVTTKTGLVVDHSLEDVIVTSLSSGGSGGEDLLAENGSLNFRKFTYAVGGNEFSWDIATNS